MTEPANTELAVREQAAISLSGDDGPSPKAAVNYARECAVALAGVLSEGNGYRTIGERKHPTIEGVQTLAAMTHHSIEIEWAHPVNPEISPPSKTGVSAWEARAIMRDRNGRVVAAGESMAEPSEGAFWGRSNYAVRSMAQTRAMGRCGRGRLGYIFLLAGLSATPAEEIGSVEDEVANRATGTKPKAVPKSRRKRPDVIEQRRLEAEARAYKLGQDPAGFFGGMGVNHPDRLDDDILWARVQAELSAMEKPAVEGEVVEEGA